MDFVPSESCHRKRCRGDVECNEEFTHSGPRKTKILRVSDSSVAFPGALVEVVSSSALSVFSDDEDDYPDQDCVSETIRSLESELGIRTQEDSSCSQSDLLDEGRLDTEHSSCSLDVEDVASAVALNNDLSKAAQDGPFLEIDDGDLWSDMRSSPGSGVLSEYSCSPSHIDFSLLWEVLDDQLGVLQNQPCDELQSFTCHEGVSVCSFHSLAADSYGCTILEEDLWGDSSVSLEHWGNMNVGS